MSPSKLSWLQGCLFLFLGIAGSYGLFLCQKRRTNHRTILSDVEMGSLGGVREAMAFTGSPSRHDRKRLRQDRNRLRSKSRTPKVPERRKKRRFMEFVAIDEARSAGRPEPADMIVAASASTWMASTTAGLRRPPHRHFVSRPSREIPLVDQLQANTSDGLRHRLMTSQGARVELTEFRYRGVRYRPERGTWIAEMKPPRCKNKYSFGDIRSAVEAALAIDAAFFYYEMPHRMNFLLNPAMMAMRPPMQAGLNEVEKLRFVREKAKLLAKYSVDNRVYLPSKRGGYVVIVSHTPSSG